MLKKRIIGFAVLILSLTNSSAQQLLDSVIVASNRLEVRTLEAGKNITIISSDQIEALPVNSVDELLTYIGGVNLNNRAAFGVQSDIGLRGSTFSQVLVVVDNQRLNDPLTGHFNNIIPVPLSEIARVEIVRGPASASFGADAVGGVIHIITKAFENMDKAVSKSSSGSYAFGENKLRLLDGGYAQQGKNIGFSLAVKSSISEGESLVNPNYTNAGRGDSLYNNHFDMRTYTGAITYRKNALKMYARLGYDYRLFNAKYFYTASAFDESEEEVAGYWSQAYVSYQGSKAETRFSISYKNNKDSFSFNPLFTANRHQTERVNASLYQLRKVGNFMYTIGAQSDFQKIVSTDRGDHQITSNALYALTNFSKGSLRINGGLRLEHSEKIGLQLVPQVNASLLKNNWVLRSSFGRSIRQADFTERYTSYLIPNLSPGRNAGNPDLLAESAYTLDLGVDFYQGKSLKLSNTVFYRTSSNLIDYVFTASDEISNLTNLQDSASYLYARNISEAQTFGNELSLRYLVAISEANSLQVNVNYTFLQTVTADTFTSKYIANHPSHNLALNAVLNVGRFNVMLGGNYILRDEESVASINATIPANYMVVNSRLTFTPSGSPLGIYLEARNLMDTSYQEILGAQMPGRWLLAGLKWSI